jgi:glycosyltransferase involved in cell wall biosynthesis
MAAVLKWQKASGALEAVRRWVAISDFMRDTFIEAGIPPERVVTLRHFCEPRPEAPAVEEDDYYLFLGRFVREKGVPVLLEAWKMLGGELGSACPKLVLAGTGPLEPLVREAAAKSPAVRCEGYVDGDRKDRLIARARGLLAPSVWWEPLGLVTYEAYDQARPILAAASGGLRETVEDGATGFLCEPGSAEALADAVRRAELAGTEGRRQMGLRGREWLLRETSKDRWLEAFNRIVAEASA